MQSKGAIKLFAILLIIASIYQLSFSFVTWSVEKDAKEYAAKFDPSERASKEKHYLDSIQDKVVYNLGFKKFTYMECKEKELNLGLDLRGGMSVTLTVDVQELVRALAVEECQNEPIFNKALASGNKAVDEGRDEFVSAFADAYVANGGNLAKAFAKPGRKINSSSSKKDVVNFLNDETKDAVDASIDILKARIDRFGVVQPNIQTLEKGRIQVDLPGVKEPERVRQLLQSSASLEFWLCYDINDIYPQLEAIDNVIRQGGLALIAEDKDQAEVKTDSVTLQPTVQKSLLDMVDSYYSSYGIVGVVSQADKDLVDKYINDPYVKEMLPEDLRLMWSVKPNNHMGGKYILYALRAVDGKPVLDGSAVEDARAQYSDNSINAEVTLTMTTTGERAWTSITRKLAREFHEDPNPNKGDNGRSLAIVMDKQVYSAPGVKEEISGGNSVITGDFTIKEAQDLANVLKSGRVEAPARIIQDNVVGPSLGKEAINSGLISFVLAFCLVLLYMGLFYKTAGWVADITLILNVFLLMGVLVSFGAVLTLPGIAGIVLTMGMAVDANVIIYERIKEELRGGKGLAMAIKDGFSNAYSAIIDGNLTTIITGIVLFSFGSGPIQGFATTLIIGILTSLFCAIFITRMILEWIVEKWGKVSFSRSWSENWLANTKFDFIGKRKYSYLISGIVIVASVCSLMFHGLNTGVEFTGGRTYQVRFDNTEKVSVDKIRTDLNKALTSDNAAESSVEVMQFGGEDQIRITTQYKHRDTSEETTREVDSLIYNALKDYYKEPISLDDFTSTQENEFGIVSSEKIGPAIAKDMVNSAIWAVLASLIAIALYITIRFRRWQWATGATFALAHNAFIVIGIFSMLYSFMPFNLEVNQAFIAAILTIIGYSINDTVVIFDRIREYLDLYPKRDIRININQAINSTLSRTMNTSGTTLVTLLAIFIFGGEALRGFVFALLLGIIIGTYSSVFIATPIAYDILRKKNGKKE